LLLTKEDNDLRRVFIDGPLTNEVSIIGDDAYHLVRVLRVKPGDELVVVGQDGQASEAVIHSVTTACVTAVLSSGIDRSVEPPVSVWLAQGLPKGDKMDLVVQKAVEIGAQRIIPLATDHSVVRYDEAKQRSRAARWQKVAGEAGKQCGRGRIPEVTNVITLPELLAGLEPGATLLMLYEGETTNGIRQVLGNYAGGTIVLLIGPEGGFSTTEVELCRKHGAQIVTMGPRILRTETAAIAALAIVMYQCGDLGG
jgi:16S rRNA (uracil1498-N3)-methyltransferase